MSKRIVLVGAAAFVAGAVAMWAGQRLAAIRRTAVAQVAPQPAAAATTTTSTALVDGPPAPLEERDGKFVNSIGIEFVRIEPGEFLMGDPGHTSDEFQHKVKLTKPFLIATTELTQAQWAKLNSGNPSNMRSPDRPVEQMPWTEAVQYCKSLSAKERRRYVLPTEAQWEYACRAGTGTVYRPEMKNRTLLA